MQMDYGLEQTNPIHDNLFYDPIQDWTMAGGLWLGSKGISKVGDMRWKNKADRQELLERDSRVVTRKNSPTPYRQNRVGQGLGAQYRARHTSYKTAAKSFGRMGKFFGFAGMAEIAFQGGMAIMGARDSFRVSREELEAQRYQRMFDHETYYDTRIAHTQRQRALQVIHNSRLSMRPALGNESQYLHA